MVAPVSTRLTHSVSSPFTSRLTRLPRGGNGRRLQQPCRAASDDERKLSFDANKRAALGYTESDSAGQTNIFAVEPRSYVAGSTRDQTKDAGNSTTGAAAIAGTVAVGAFIAGLILLNESSKTDLGPTGEFLTLSQYKAQFASESSAARPAPVSAPEVVEEN